MELINFSEANCRSCYKCLRSCAVKAIRVKNDQARIVPELCVACGQCLAVCPQNARKIASDLHRIKSAINHKRPVLAIVAPSFAGAFNFSSPLKLITVLKAVGFQQVFEAAHGADIVTKLYNDYIRTNEKSSFITTSCPTVNYIIEAYYPSLVDKLIPIDSPMIALGKVLKQTYDNAFITFIGPCYSKKFESCNQANDGIIDAVLTFEELSKWLYENNVDVESFETSSFDSTSSTIGKSFPLLGKLHIENSKGFDHIVSDGMDKCMELFKGLEKGEIRNVIIEALACDGGCINGPAMPKNAPNYFIRTRNVRKYINETSSTNSDSTTAAASIDFRRVFQSRSTVEKQYDEERISNTLKKMGKHSKQDELNCGVCGYNTCREKAMAVLNGMAEINMCIHYIRNKAESITNVVFETSPNAILTLDDELLIKDFNPSSERLFKIKLEEVKDKPICMLMDDSDFYKVKESKASVIGKKLTFTQYDLVVLLNIIYLEKQGVFLVIMNDITMQEKSKGELQRVKKKTLDAAQTVIEKQMRVAQEIASLLGETTAETKVILTRLKEIALEEVSESL